MISAQDFKRAMARLAGAVNVITTRDEQGQAWGFTATAFCSLSLQPPLVLFCLGQDADCYQAFLRARSFAVNMLSEQQRELAQRFATKGRAKYRETAFAGGKPGPPLLPGSLVTLECSVQNIYPGGDHSIITGLVERAELAGDGAGNHPLLYYAQTYGTFAGQPVENTGQNLAAQERKSI
jgi:flavin reductase ActVB